MELDFGNNLTAYTSALFVAALLLVIFWSLLKIDKQNKLPPFCKKCVNMRIRLFSAPYCRLKCKYNPAYRYSYEKSYYVKKKG